MCYSTFKTSKCFHFLFFLSESIEPHRICRFLSWGAIEARNMEKDSWFCVNSQNIWSLSCLHTITCAFTFFSPQKFQWFMANNSSNISINTDVLKKNDFATNWWWLYWTCNNSDFPFETSQRFLSQKIVFFNQYETGLWWLLSLSLRMCLHGQDYCM